MVVSTLFCIGPTELGLLLHERVENSYHVHLW